MRSKSVIILSLYSPSVNNYLHVNHTNFELVLKNFFAEALTDQPLMINPALI